MRDTRQFPKEWLCSNDNITYLIITKYILFCSSKYCHFQIIKINVQKYPPATLLGFINIVVKILFQQSIDNKTDLLQLS